MEDLGHPTIMLTGGRLTDLAEVAAVVHVTRTARIVTRHRVRVVGAR